MPSWILFRYDLYPQLEKMHKKYRRMRLALVKCSMSNSESVWEKGNRTYGELNRYAWTEYAEAVYEIFEPLKPRLHNRRRGGDFAWEEVFDKPFAELTDEKRGYLVGLIEHDFVYELPPEYYEDKRGK